MTAEASASASSRIQREENSFARVAPRIGGRVLIYAALAIWTFIALFPLYWTLSTSFKLGRDVTQGHLVPWLDFTPSWKGWQSLGLSPDTIFTHSNVRDEFLKQVPQQRHRLARRLGAGGDDRLARGLRAQPIRVQIRADGATRTFPSSSCRS